MIDHIAMPCTDIERSRAFYEQVLGAIGITPVPYGAPAVGFGDAHGAFFWLGPAPGSKPLEVHIAFRVADRDQVHEFHRQALAAGAEILHEPRVFPEYHPNYYAVFVRDPDGHNVEAVSHRPQG